MPELNGGCVSLPEMWNWADIVPYANNAVYVGRQIPSNAVSIKGLNCGAGAAAPSHSHPYDQWAMVIGGEVTITCGNKAFRLSRGSVLHIPAGTVHSAIYETDCDLLEFGLGVDPV